MLIGLYITRDSAMSSNLVSALSSKFQGITFVALKDLNQDLNMATLASGTFDKIIVYISAFNGLGNDRIIDELSSLRTYKEVRAFNVSIQIVDKINSQTNTGILDSAYRKFFGQFVDCRYFVKQEFNGSILADLIRDSMVSDEKFEDKKQYAEVNSAMMQALSSKSSREDVGREDVSRGDAPETESVEKSSVEEEPEIRNFMGENKRLKSIKRNPFKFGNSRNKDKEEVPKREEPKVEKPAPIETSVEIQRQEVEMPEVQMQEVPRQDVQRQDVPTGGNRARINVSIDNNYSSEFYGAHIEPTPSAVSRSPEVINRQESFTFKTVDEQINEQFKSTNMFNMQDDLSNERLMLEQMKLRELELKARMLEAQAQIKSTELETAQRNSLVSPVRMSEERVNGYVDKQKSRSKIILVTGLKYSGKTTVTKLLGEILSSEGSVLCVDGDIQNRALSNTYSNIGDDELTRLGFFRALRDKGSIENYITPVSPSLDALGTEIGLSEAEELSLKNRFDCKLIQPMLRKISNMGVYPFILFDCPLEILNESRELLDVCDNVLWISRGSKYGISSLVNELEKDTYDEFFLNKVTIILNGELNQNSRWNKFFNTDSMWADNIADSLGAIVPFIENYDESFWQDISGIELRDFRVNMLEVVGLM